MFRNGPRSSAVSSCWLRRSRRSCRPARALLQPPAPPADSTRMATDLRSPSSRIVHPDKDRFLNEENPFEAMMSRFDRAAQLLDLEPGLYKVLRHPEKQITVSVPVLMDNGEVEVFTGHRVLYNTSRGPAKGGIRFDLNVTLRSEEHTSELQSHVNLVCRLLLEKKKILCTVRKMSPTQQVRTRPPDSVAPHLRPSSFQSPSPSSACFEFLSSNIHRRRP